jgi:hypothetical protein
MQLASSAQTLVPSRAVYLIFMSVPCRLSDLFSKLPLWQPRRDATTAVCSLACRRRTRCWPSAVVSAERSRSPGHHLHRKDRRIERGGQIELCAAPGRWAGVDASPLSLGGTGAHSLAASDLIAVPSVVHRPGHRYSAIAIPLALLIWWGRAPIPDFRISTATSPLPTKPLLRMVASDSARQCAAQVPKSRQARAVDREWTTHKECSATRPTAPPRTTSLVASADPAPSGRCYWKGIVSA